MDARQSRYKWNHPIPVYLLEANEQRVGILDIIDKETENLLSTLRTQRPSIFSGEVATPIERILDELNVQVTNLIHSRALGITERVGSTVQIKLNKHQHYFRRRFTLAHELAHVWLNQIAGPFTFDELARTKDTNHEEEFLCDVFASSVLMPKPAILSYLQEDEFTRVNLNRIATEFKVSISAVLRRLACLRDAILLFWSEICNPLKENSQTAARIEFVYPNLRQLHDYFVPLYCTASDTRFEPNIILRSFEEQSDITGNVTIRGLGSLPDGVYRVHNIFFNRWSSDTNSLTHIGRRRNRCDMVSILELPKDRY
jgi:hypothetical protein